MDTIMTVKDVTKQYKMGEVIVDALRGVSFEIYEGEFIAILGPSGSGKSTILNIIGGIDFPTSGEIYYADKALHLATEKQLTDFRKEAIGFVFQFYNLIPNLTARENIELGAELSENPISVDRLLKKIQLSDRAGHFPSKMSGGQQQRVALARAVAKNPEILLCDEPTGALDFTTGIQVLRILKDFNEEYGKTVIIITHNAGISEIADRTFYVRDGLITDIKTNENPIPPEEVSW